MPHPTVELYKNETLARLEDGEKPLELLKSPTVGNSYPFIYYILLLESGWVTNTKISKSARFYPDIETLTFFEG